MAEIGESLNNNNVAEVDEPPNKTMATPQKASLSFEFAQVLEKYPISPGDMQSYLDKLQGHYVSENGYKDDVLDAIDDRWVLCLIMSSLGALDSEVVNKWLQEIAQNKKWPVDGDLPLSPGRVAGLRYFNEHDQSRFIEVQRKFCGSYEMGKHSIIELPMLPPFYIGDTPLGDGTYAIVEAVELVHHDGQQKAISYARKRPKDDGANSILEEELKTLSNMDCHHHVVQCVGSYRYGGYTHILLSPQACNGNLSKYLGGKLSKRKATILKSSFGCLMSGLGFFSAKMRHKDIKPENILVDGSRVLFTDFGSAYIFGKGGLGAATSRTFAGNVNWMYAAPEVHMTNGKRDVKTDLFSLGCVFAEIIAVLSGKAITEFHKIMKGDTTGIRYAYRVDQLHNWLDELSKTKPELSLPIGWCKDMTQKDPANRPRIPALIRRVKEQCGDKLETYFCLDCLTKPAGTLSAVAEEGNEGKMKSFLNDEAKVNKMDDYGLTPLSAAAVQGEESMVVRLLDANANANIKDPNEEGTSLHWAAEGGDPNTIRHILGKGNANIDEKSRTHGTPLSWAVQNKSIDSAKLLLESGADISLKNPAGLTPLHLAAQGGNKNLVQLLLKHGANMAEMDGKGRTALKLAEGSGNEEAAALLREDASPVLADVDQERTPLDTMAAGSGELDSSKPSKIIRKDLQHLLPHRSAQRWD